MDPPADLPAAVSPHQRRRPRGQRGGRTSRQIEWAMFSTILFSVLTLLKFGPTVRNLKSMLEPLIFSDQPSSTYTGNNGSGAQNKFIVWMYPFPPPNIEVKDDWEVPSGGQIILICPYKTACQGKGSTINLAELTKDTFYNSYILDHTYHKLRHMKEFCHHIQVITMISLLLKNDGACTQTLGGDTWFCSAESFSDYNPYDNGEQSWSASTESRGKSDLSISKFPYPLLSHQDKGSISKEVLSLAPDMTSEEFATYGPWNVSTDLRLSGRYNSGEDIQSLAGVGWYPFVSSIREKENPYLNNYSGHYIANSLQSPPMAMPYLEDIKERRNLMEKLDIVSMFFGGAAMIQKNEKFLREYTNEVFPFGCRSTKTCAMLKKHRIRSYFSSCLTLTSTYQGSVLYNDGSLPNLNSLPFLNPAFTNFTIALRKAKQEKDLVLLVDVVDRSVLPPLPSNHRWLSADIPKGYPRSCQPQSERIDYCYRLLSQYANHAKVVITSRIHVGLPAAALGTPVIFVSQGGWLPGGKEQSGRVAGLLDIFHRLDKKRNLTLGFDLSGPIPPNPGNHEADRRRAAFWHRLKRVSYYEDAARVFGRIPLQRLGAAMLRDDIQNNFHFVMNQTDLNDWRSRRTIEAVLFFHPNAKITIHVEGYIGGSQGEFAIFVESGYDVILTPISSQRASVEQIQALLQKFGGVFLSKGTFIRGTLSIALDEGYYLDEYGDVALMIGKKDLISSKATNRWVASYLSSTETKQCMSDPNWKMKSTEDIAITVDRASLLEDDIVMDTSCYDLIEKNCIYNDDLHWKYGDETGVLLELSDGSTARYCEGNMWNIELSCKERVEYMKGRHRLSDHDAMISTLNHGCLCAKTDDNKKPVRNFFNATELDDADPDCHKETSAEALDFIHITKTGGTSIEGAAAQIGIAWGYCKYHPEDKFCVPSPSRNHRNRSTMSMDTKCKIGGPKKTSVALWHCPPNHLQMNEGNINGKGGQTQHQVHHQSNINTSKTFAIVRDPYSRIISEYYWAHSWARKDEKHSTAEYLNSWIKKQLALVEKFGACVHGHCIPMYKYTHDDSLPQPSQSNTSTLPRQVADHIIHLENITVELPVLMEQYGHPYKDIQLGKEKRKGRRTDDKLDVHHLTNETLCMINRWAEMDFKLFGYEMIEVAGCFNR